MPIRLAARNILVHYAPEIPPVLSEFSLEIEAGTFVGVIGPNGSGKSSLIRALSRALKPAGGSVLLETQDLYTAYSARESAQSIGVVPQDTSISLDFSVREVVRMGRAPFLPVRPFASESADDEQIVTDALRAARMEDLAERAVTALSGGERQRVLLARALAQQSEILLLDEPTASLDLRHQTETLTLARDLAHKEGKAIVAVLHDVNLAAAYCDTLVLLDHGRIAASGTPADVLTAEHLQAVFGARVWVRPHPATGRPWVLSLPEMPIQNARIQNAQSQNTRRVRVHVICGGGTGAGLLLSLHGLGYPLTAAVLHAGDADADAAQMLGVSFAREDAFSILSYAALERAASLAADADIVVVTETPFGRANFTNLEAALSLQCAGKRVVCVQEAEAEFTSRDFTAGLASKAWATLLASGAVVLPSQAAVLAYLEKCS